MAENFENKENRTLDKRLCRIERWLRRCMVACRCGSWSSALMEIECMEAETRAFREDLWKSIEDEAMAVSPKSFRAQCWMGLKVAAIALVIVMAAGLPLSVDQDRPFRFETASVAVLTSTESDILNALRASLSERNTGSRVILSIEREEATPPGATGAALAEDLSGKTEKRTVTRVLEPISRPVANIEKAEKTNEEKEEKKEKKAPPTVDEVISLIQVGQRALRISEPAVKVVP